MSINNFTVKINFNDGTYDYDLPYVFQVADPKEGMKSVDIEGVAKDGSNMLPGGKKSQEIRIRGRVFGDDYDEVQENLSELKTKITTDIATLTLKYWNGSTWVNNWQYTVRRIEPIKFRESLRRRKQEYEVSFLVLVY